MENFCRITSALDEIRALSTDLSDDVVSLREAGASGLVDRGRADEEAVAKESVIGLLHKAQAELLTLGDRVQRWDEHIAAGDNVPNERPWMVRRASC